MEAKTDDLRALMPLLCDKIAKSDTDNVPYQHCQELFIALEGDLVSTAQIADMLQNTGSHFRSLIASLLTGNTQFDSLEEGDESSSSIKQHHSHYASESEGEEEKAEQKTHKSKISDITEYQKGKNLLLREVFRFFELATRQHFGATHPPKQVERFIKTSFARNIPIYLLILMAEDKNMLESLVKVEEKFGVGLILRKQISKLSFEERYKEKNEMKDFM